MASGEPRLSEWNVFTALPFVGTSSNLLSVLGNLRSAGISKIILPVAALSQGTALDYTLSRSLIVHVSSVDSISMTQERNLYGLFLDAASATSADLIQEAIKCSLPTYLTINALSRREVDRLIAQFPTGSVVIVWEGRHSSQRNSTVDMISLHQVAKLRRLFDLPVCYLGRLDRIESLLAFVLGAGTVITTLDPRFVMEISRVNTQSLVLIEEFIKQVEEIREDCTASQWPSPSPEEWDIIENGMTSLFAARFIHKGETLTHKMIEVRSPYQGVGASLLPRLIGCKAKHDLQPGDAITFGLLDLDSVIKS